MEPASILYRSSSRLCRFSIHPSPGILVRSDMPLKAPSAQVADAFDKLSLPQDPQQRNRTLTDFVNQASLCLGEGHLLRPIGPPFSTRVTVSVLSSAVVDAPRLRHGERLPGAHCPGPARLV